MGQGLLSVIDRLGVALAQAEQRIQELEAQLASRDDE